MVPDLAEEEEVTIDAGMPVVTEDGESLGTLASLLVDEDTDEAGFLIVKKGDVERLVPFEAVLDVEEGNLVLEVDTEEFEDLPQTSSDRDPTDAEMEMAYRVLGLEEMEEDEEEEEEKEG